MYQAVIRGTGSYLPEKRLTNHELERLVETSDEWIVTRTGIKERRIAAAEEATSDLAYHAAAAALADAGISAEQIDMILVATETPDHPFPPVACQLQHRLGCREIAVYDVHLVCTGFIAALHNAEAYIKLGRYENILVVGADLLSGVTDYTDRTTCILFADGAGAAVVSRGNGEDSRGILHSELHANGSLFEAAIIPGGGSRFRHAGEEEPKRKIVMEGRKIFKHAVQGMSRSVRDTVAAAGHTLDQVDWLIPHQANQRIMDAVAEQLAFPAEKVISTIRHIGNNSSATIPIALDLAVKEGRIQRGDLVALTAFGGGLAWGSLLMEY